jgi:hypothetical protein
MIRSLFTALLECAIDAWLSANARRYQRAELLAWRMRAERAEQQLQHRDIVVQQHYAQQSYGRWGAN